MAEPMQKGQMVCGFVHAERISPVYIVCYHLLHAIYEPSPNPRSQVHSIKAESKATVHL